MNLPKIVFIIGIGRSGSSLLTNCLVNNGFSIGKNKNKDKNWQNPNGYFENDSFTHFHEKLLSFNKSTWLYINNLPMKYTNKHIHEYRNLLKNEFLNENLILVKDPRLTFFVDFLKEVCNNIYTPYFLFLTRNKEECCQSLAKAQNKTLRSTNQLYETTQLSYRNNFLKIDHRDIIFNNRQVLTNISEFIDVKLNTDVSNLVDLNLYRNRNCV